MSEPTDAEWASWARSFGLIATRELGGIRVHDAGGPMWGPERERYVELMARLCELVERLTGKGPAATSPLAPARTPGREG